LNSTDKNMRNFVIKIFMIGAVAFFLTGCSELETNIEQPDSITVHKEGILNPHSQNFHGNLIRENGWEMRDCQQCHSAAYSGGVVQSSCLTCHTNPGGPEACNTCHGSFADPTRIAPPRDISGNILPSSRGVGVHSKHLYDNVMGKAVLCESCHNVPQRVYDPGHLDDDLPAEVILKDLAVFSGGENAAYNPADQTCSNTYCHGSFEFYRDDAVPENRFAYTADKMVGINNTVSWTAVNSSEMECGSCHGLPPEGHIIVPITSCYQCHQGVVDELGNIIDKTKHINGVKNSRGN
jgi:hypothetical protein